MNTDRLLTELRAKVDPKYRPPSGEWIHATQPARLLSGPPGQPRTREYVAPAGTVLKVSMWWDDGGLSVKNYGQPPRDGDYLLAFLSDWPAPGWEIIEDAEQGRRS